MVSDRYFQEKLRRGKLTILDCGRLSKVQKDEMLKLWTMFLCFLQEKPKDPNEHYLLVFDELGQILEPTPSAEQIRFGQRLEIMARLSRHLHVSILGLSQTAQDLVQIAAFASHATVLLFHKLKINPPQLDDQTLWGLASRGIAAFPDLDPGEVFYASNSGREISGRVQLPMPGRKAASA